MNDEERTNARIFHNNPSALYGQKSVTNTLTAAWRVTVTVPYMMMIGLMGSKPINLLHTLPR